jgi:glycosyltransferase involved in cell wall biosynthesis
MPPVRIVYPLLWSRPGRDACREQSVNTAAAFARAGVETVLLMPQGRDDPSLSADDLRSWFEVEGNFRLIQRHSPPVSGKIVPSTLWLRRLFRDPEVLRSSLLYSRIPNMLVMDGGAPIPFATDHYRPWPDHWPWLKPFIRRTAAEPHCLGLVIHSHFAAGSYARCGVDPGRILVAHNGADPRRIGERLDKADARRAIGLPEDSAIALYAGRVNRKKGLETLLEMARLRPDVLFVIVGSEGRGPIEQAAQEYANVRIVGWQEPGQLAPWLQAADVLLIPPARAPLETHRNCVLPIKLFGYLAAGRPILAPVAPDTAELLEDGENALLVPPDDPPTAVAALDRVLADSGLAARLSQNAQAAGERLTWDARAAKILPFLRARLEAVQRSE